MLLKFKPLHDNAVLPKFAHDDDACFDLTAASRDDVNGNSRIYNIGVSSVIPDGHYVEVAIRSGLAFNGGFILANGVGIIDAGYRGEWCAKLVYLGGDKPDWPRVGDRVAQARLVKLTKTTIEWTEDSDETERGEGGFGSSGK